MSDILVDDARPVIAIQDAVSADEPQLSTNIVARDTGCALICDRVKMSIQNSASAGNIVHTLNVQHMSGDDSTPFISSAETSPNDITDANTPTGIIRPERRPSAKWANKMRRNMRSWISLRDKGVSMSGSDNDKSSTAVRAPLQGDGDVDMVVKEEQNIRKKEEPIDTSRSDHVTISHTIGKQSDEVEYTHLDDKEETQESEFRSTIARQLSAPQPFHDLTQVNNATSEMQMFKVSAQRVRKVSAPDITVVSSAYLSRFLDGEIESQGFSKYVSRETYRNDGNSSSGSCSSRKNGEALHKAARDQKFVFSNSTTAQQSGSRKYFLSKSAANLHAPSSAPNMAPLVPPLSANSMHIRSSSRDQISNLQVGTVSSFASPRGPVMKSPSLASPRGPVMKSPCSPRRASMPRRMTYEGRAGSFNVKSLNSYSLGQSQSQAQILAQSREMRASPALQSSPRNQIQSSPRSQNTNSTPNFKSSNNEARRLKNVSSAEPATVTSSLFVHEAVKRSSSDRLCEPSKDNKATLKLGQAERWTPSESTGPSSGASVSSRGSTSTASTSTQGQKEIDHELVFGTQKRREIGSTKSLRQTLVNWLPRRKARSKSTPDAMGSHSEAAVELFLEGKATETAGQENSPLALQKTNSLDAAARQPSTETHDRVYVPLSSTNRKGSLTSMYSTNHTSSIANRSQYSSSSFRAYNSTSNTRGQISAIPSVARSRTYSPSFRSSRGQRDASPLSFSGSPSCVRRRSFATPQREPPSRVLTAAQAATTDSLPASFKQQLSGGLKRAWLFSSGSAPASRRESEISTPSETVSEDEELICPIEPSSGIDSPLQPSAPKECSAAMVGAMTDFNLQIDSSGNWHAGAKRSSSLGPFSTPSRDLLKQYTRRLDKHNSTGTSNGRSTTSLDANSELLTEKTSDGIMDCVRQVNEFSGTEMCGSIPGRSAGVHSSDEIVPVSILKSVSSYDEDINPSLSVDGVGLETINDGEVFQSDELGYSGVYARNVSAPEVYNDYSSDYLHELNSGWDGITPIYDGIGDGFTLDESEFYDEEEVLDMITETEDEDMQVELDPGEMSAAEATRASKIATAKLTKQYRGSDLSKSMNNLRLSTDAIFELAE